MTNDKCSMRRTWPRNAELHSAVSRTTSALCRPPSSHPLSILSACPTKDSTKVPTKFPLTRTTPHALPTINHQLTLHQPPHRSTLHPPRTLEGSHHWLLDLGHSLVIGHWSLV